MRILTWNVNGLATTLQYHPWHEKKSYKFLLDTLGADIICLQEVKCQRSKLTRDMAIVSGYNAYHSFSKAKLGYSGTAVYVKDHLPLPVKVSEGITGVLDKTANEEMTQFVNTLATPAETLDAEGRCIILDFDVFILFNIYFPNYASEARGVFIMDYYACVRKRIDMYLAKGKQVILVGDVNAVHEELDHCDPKESMRVNNLEDFKDLPHRRWVDELIDPKGPLIDMARHFHPNRRGMFTCWNTRINARPANYGTRIDYVLASKGLKDRFIYADIQSDVMGSDHCPVYADFDITPDTLPQGDESSALLTTNFSEFSNKQKKLHSYFTAKSNTTSSSSSSSLSNAATTTTTTTTTTSSSLSSASGEQSKRRNNSNTETRTTTKKQKGLDAFFIKENKDQAYYCIDKQDFNNNDKAAWSTLFRPPQVPKCRGHNETCVERTVTKKGPNLGRVFYLCPKPVGPQDGPKELYSCNFFAWKQQSSKEK
ncbi:Class II abasic (AP) endonuclease [Rhizopus azygosporus]|uniref:DNA-(apurinic or apyrimidinic site) endonuclease n=1 Tax=Rhizopus azygosporus TaxID=86630 RepID=A0A367J955_RHIAZ|nr:Class II abasic (AP) endonuclease [Rhizopus azygosporus]